jgi:hypothetical protein
MKKYFYLLMLSALFVGCSSDGSREIQIDECEFIHSDICKTEEFSKLMSVLEVVPGKYELAWKLVDDLPQLQNYSVSLKLKLRLKKKVNVKEEVINKISEAEVDYTSPVSFPFTFKLVDADGKVDNSVQRFNVTDTSVEDVRKNKVLFNKDQTMDFLRFLQSEPGTEIELLVYALGSKHNNQNCIEVCKNAKGIICDMSFVTDSNFEAQIGTIQ